MRPVSLKWKIFIVANYLLLIVFTFFLGFLIWFTVKRGLLKSDLPTFIPTVAGLSFIIFNAVFNLVIFYKYFPDKDTPRRIKRLYLLQTVLYIIALAALGFLIYLGFEEEVLTPQKDNTGFILLCMLFLLWIIALFVLAIQLRWMRFIKRNYNALFSSYIENIGTG